MAAAVLERAGIALVHNRAGANMAGGVASTLLQAARRGGAIDGQFGLFELDEFWLDRVVPQLRPRAVLLGNLFRDQLDRYGELETIADRWAATVAGLPAGTALACNADDPLIADLGRQHPGVRYFGVEDPAMATAEMQHASDSKHCRRCGHAYVYDAIYLGHLGVYHCPNCGQRRPDPTVSAHDIELHGTRSADLRAAHAGRGAPRSSSPSPASTTSTTRWAPRRCASGLGVALRRRSPPAWRRSAPPSAAPSGSRSAPTSSSILLIKNPAGANEILRTLVLEPDELDLLAILNDRTADGRDISWIWDADFEMLAGRVRHVTCAGTRAAELALRLKYAGVSDASGSRSSRPWAPALDAALAGIPGRPAVRAAHLHGAAGAAPGAAAPRARRRLLVT